MSPTDVAAQALPIRLNLVSGTVVEAGEARAEGVTGSGFGIYRAFKSRRLIDECIDVLNAGGVASLVPTSASDSYLEAIAAQVEKFAATRSVSTQASDGGVLALPTSGSTGNPKLVALPAAGLIRFWNWGIETFGFENTTVSLSLSPWNFDVSLLDTWAVLAAAGTVVAAEPARLNDATYLARLLDQHRPTFIQVVPSTLEALIIAAGNASYPSVRNVVLTGGVVSRHLRAAASRAFPAATFHNVYGATEVNDCLIATLSADDFAAMETLPIGIPMSGCDVLIDSDGVRVPVQEAIEGTRGELLVRTPWRALGYIDAATITPLPQTADGFYPMKDEAVCSEGQLMYQGRRDRMIKVRGQRVNLEEIEHAARRTGLVGMACAWLETSESAEGLHLAYTVPDRGPAASGLKLRIAMSARLPAFAMPNHLHAFTEPFPLNGNGKPDLSTIKSRTESA